ncbi:8363_t:CDS:10 [Ambispora gerdemannii]|uniref:8363_t:CDS:1 n=1 Tax=Ambispora gerdemannii TaxID=144530 RepID=A0A9N9C426_9GLOM|nr:8363_t:CDS:10 [Ambispora gerdemannii]
MDDFVIGFIPVIDINTPTRRTTLQTEPDHMKNLHNSRLGGNIWTATDHPVRCGEFNSSNAVNGTEASTLILFNNLISLIATRENGIMPRFSQTLLRRRSRLILSKWQRHRRINREDPRSSSPRREPIKVSTSTLIESKMGNKRNKSDKVKNKHQAVSPKRRKMLPDTTEQTNHQTDATNTSTAEHTINGSENIFPSNTSITAGTPTTNNIIDTGSTAPASEFETVPLGEPGQSTPSNGHHASSSSSQPITDIDTIDAENGKTKDPDSESECEESVVLMAGVAPEPSNGHVKVVVKRSEIDRKKLEDILQKDGESDNEDETMTDVEQSISPEPNFTPSQQEGFCIDCKDQEASYFCEQCKDEFCEVCFAMLHRTGNRKNHITRNLKSKTLQVPSNKSLGKASTSASSSTSDLGVDDELTGSESEFTKTATIISNGGTTFGQWLEERCKFIPIRLNMDERKMLRLLEAALNVSEYTDRIDIMSFSPPSAKAKRMVHQIRDLCWILSGLLIAHDYKKGQELIADHTFKDNEEFFKMIFEIGRRHKVMNPEKMRDVYGKLMYMLMDSTIDDVQQILGFDMVKPIKNVYEFLVKRNCIELLHNEHVVNATKEIIADGKSREQVQREIREKERAIEILSRDYQNSDITPDEIKLCLYSIGDNHAYLRSNRDCCDRMLNYLSTYFSPSKIDDGYSLAIRPGSHGARLSHTHEMQFYYANQTLSLWREIQNEMFMLWTLADRDLLSDTNTYRLRDTGQGLNRVQMCPNVSKAMHSILHRAQQKARYWVGSSVIHLGDKNVPNALMFIDKYNQVARILNPILICLDSIEPLIQKNVGIRNYINNTYGGPEKLRKDILADFFRYAFDGSGADNFFDAGSCIDGRLTSAWNWCSQIEKKVYFPVFLLTLKRLKMQKNSHCINIPIFLQISLIPIATAFLTIILLSTIGMGGILLSPLRIIEIFLGFLIVFHIFVLLHFRIKKGYFPSLRSPQRMIIINEEKNKSKLLHQLQPIIEQMEKRLTTRGDYVQIAVE